MHLIDVSKTKIYVAMQVAQNVPSKLTIFVPTFEENGILMLGVVFLFSQFSSIEIIIFNQQKFLIPH